jgi:hypothetical protein
MLFKRVLSRSTQLTTKTNLVKTFKNVKLINSNFSTRLSEDTNKFDLSSLKNTIKSELGEIEKNYEPVSDADKNTFLTTGRWVLIDKPNTKKIELRKSTGEFDVTVKFSSRAPEVNTDESGRIIISFLIIINLKKLSFFINTILIYI